MKQKLFNLITYTMLAYAIFSAAWVSLPELQAALPWLNLPTALVSGGSTAFVGSVGLVVQNYLKSAKTVADTQFLGLADGYDKVAKTIIEMKNIILDSNNKVLESNALVTKVTDRNNQLLTAMLEIEKDNELVDIKAREIAEAILNEKN